MITVTVYDEQFECARAIKGKDFVQLFDENNTCIASFAGISSFDGYSIEGGDWEDPPLTPEEKLAKQIADIEDALCELDK